MRYGPGRAGRAISRRDMTATAGEMIIYFISGPSARAPYHLQVSRVNSPTALRAFVFILGLSSKLAPAKLPTWQPASLAAGPARPAEMGDEIRGDDSRAHLLAGRLAGRLAGWRPAARSLANGICQVF